MANEYEVWINKNLSGLFRDIYNNQRDTQSKINVLIDVLRPLITSAGEASVIVPLIRDYLDVGVKNDSHLVRLAAIVQRLYATDRIAASGGAAGLLTEAEKAQLLNEADIELKQLKSGTEESIKQLKPAAKEVKKLLDADEEKEKLEDIDNAV